MKISKKILGVALALIMIFNVLAVGTFAAYPADAAVKLSLSAQDGKTVYKAGDEITLIVSEQAIEDLKTVYPAGIFHIAYPTAVINPIDETSAEGVDHIEAINAGVDVAASYVQLPAAIPAEIYSADADAYGWDEAIGFGVTAAYGATVDIASETQIFSFKLKIADDAANGTYTIGFNPWSFDEWEAYALNPADNLYGNVGEDAGVDQEFIYDLGTFTFTIGEEAPAVVVAHEGTQSKWAKGNPVIADYLFGFVGSFTGLEVETESVDGRNEVTNIASIVAAATVNGGEVKYSTVNTIWKSGDKYMFRAAFADFDPTKDPTDEVSVTFTVTMADGKTYTTEAASVKTVADIFAASIDAGLEKLA